MAEITITEASVLKTHYLVDDGLESNATKAGMVGAFVSGMDGQMMAELWPTGMRSEDIHTVFFTNLHPDHVAVT